MSDALETRDAHASKNTLAVTGKNGKDISCRKSAMKHSTRGETKTSRRITWPDEKNHFMELGNTKHGKKSSNKRTSGLKVILKIDL